MKREEMAKWITFSHMQGVNNEEKNRILIEAFHENHDSLDDILSLSASFSVSDKISHSIRNAMRDMDDNIHLSEKLINSGIEIIPLNSENYSKRLKKHLKTKFSPSILYALGNNALLNTPTVAIVGSRDASGDALSFTKSVASLKSRENITISSGYARGVDRTSLFASLESNGANIIVLPQGILTFQSDLKKLRKYIDNGKVLVISAFHPLSGWASYLAMARNKYIYGLADEIYVSESGISGGTWEGAKEGLKNKQKVYVFYNGANTKEGSLRLLDSGAIAVDANGMVIEESIKCDADGQLLLAL